jgi:hypothetical protein
MYVLMVASLISRNSWTQEFPGRALLVLNSCNSRTPELLSFLRDPFQAIQPGLVTSMHSAGIFIAKGDVFSFAIRPQANLSLGSFIGEGSD